MILQRFFLFAFLKGGRILESSGCLSFVPLPKLWLQELRFIMSTGSALRTREGKCHNFESAVIKKTSFCAKPSGLATCFQAWYNDGVAAHTAKRNKVTHPEQSLALCARCAAVSRGKRMGGRQHNSAQGALLQQRRLPLATFRPLPNLAPSLAWHPHLTSWAGCVTPHRVLHSARDKP